VDATGVGGCGVRVMYGGGWGYSANKPKAIVQIDILKKKGDQVQQKSYYILGYGYGCDIPCRC